MRLAAFDFETHLAQPGLPAPPIVCGSVANGTGAHLLTKREAMTWITKALRDSTQHVVGTNIVYDLGCAVAEDSTLVPWVFRAIDEGRVHDIGIREALIDIAKGDLIDKSEDGIGIRYGMRILAQRYLNLDLRAEKQNGWRKKYAQIEHLHVSEYPWEARRYPLRDVALPLEIFRLQEGGPNLHHETHEMRAAWALHLMVMWGLRANAQRVADLRARVEAADLAATIKFREHGIIRADGTENKKRLAELVTAAYGGNPPKTAPSAKFPQGQVATDRDTLAESGDAVLEQYASAGKNDKYLTTYLPILDKAVRTPWNPQFNVLVATTRVSSDAQQFPQVGGVRECFEARAGYVFCSVDYPGLELRTMSQRAIDVVGYSKMADAMRKGLDPHLIAAGSFANLDYDEAKRRYKALDKLLKAFRDLGKIWNFGKGGGMGPGAMAYNARRGTKGETTKAPDGRVYVGSRFCLLVGRTQVCGSHRTAIRVQGKERRVCTACLDVAKELDAGWLRAWPEQAQLFQLANRLSKASRYIVAEIPRTGVKRGKCGYTQFLNTPFQGLGAVATKRAMWRISHEMYCAPASPLFGSRLVLQVHDELIAELLETRASEAGDRMATIMREELDAMVPDLAGCSEVEPALSRSLSKSAQTVRDATGKLKIWT